MLNDEVVLVETMVSNTTCETTNKGVTCGKLSKAQKAGNDCTGASTGATSRHYVREENPDIMMSAMLTATSPSTTFASLPRPPRARLDRAFPGSCLSSLPFAKSCA